MEAHPINDVTHFQNPRRVLVDFVFLFVYASGSQTLSRHEPLKTRIFCRPSKTTQNHQKDSLYHI
jgi:hypothetical protein